MKLRYLALLVCGLFFAGSARAELKIDVSGAMREPMPVAFPEMIHNGFFVGRYGKQIRDVVIADLERSGLFRIVNPRSYIQEFFLWSKNRIL